MAVRLSHEAPVFLVYVYGCIKLLRPGCDASIEVRVGDGNSLHTAQLMQMSRSLGLQDVDTVPQYVSRACKQLPHYTSARKCRPMLHMQHSCGFGHTA